MTVTRSGLMPMVAPFRRVSMITMVLRRESIKNWAMAKFGAKVGSVEYAYDGIRSIVIECVRGAFVGLRCGATAKRPRARGTVLVPSLSGGATLAPCS